ncbi:MAG: NapC/NirT family cytochrome c [Betaproteobacteria bacterium]|nr:NapC/NirT family cytochrome c [Betaproteobacteria bacterium]
MADNKDTGSVNIVRRLWNYFTHPSPSYSILAIWAVGLAIGITFWGGFNWAVEASNKLEFCISCHEMENTVYQEWQKTIHYSNRSGVRAICADCHVPKDWTYKMIRKVGATKELYGKALGTIDTPQKFEAKRLELARNEWARMKKTDSRECRNCHTFEGMGYEKQKQRAKKQHEFAKKDNQTCIDCHKGIAHNKPKGMTEEEEIGG